jgi:hypothetical protein
MRHRTGQFARAPRMMNRMVVAGVIMTTIIEGDYEWDEVKAK